MFKRLGVIGGIALILLTGCAGLIETQRRAGLQTVGPSPRLSPVEVVRIQMTAFAYNDETNSGIEIAYRFASPQNKATIGSVRRFAMMLHSGAYRPMLNPRETMYDDAEISGRRASVRVHLTSEGNYEIVYRFFLSNQETDGCNGCWMTDGVQVESVRQKTDVIRI